jgi:hypothetical protein
MDLGEIGWGGVDWIVLARDRDKWRALVDAVLNLRIYEMAIKLVASRLLLNSIIELSGYEIL